MISDIDVVVVLVVAYVVVSVLLLSIGWLVWVLSMSIKPNRFIRIGGVVKYYSVKGGVKRLVDKDKVESVESI